MLLCMLSDHLRQLPQAWQQVMDQEVLRDVWSRSQGCTQRKAARSLQAVCCVSVCDEGGRRIQQQTTSL